MHMHIHHSNATRKYNVVSKYTGQAGERNAHAPETAVVFSFILCKSFVAVVFEQ